MKEQFVTFEIAAALRELGFDGECFARFRKGSFQLNTLGTPFKQNSKPAVQGDIAAPLWQQVFEFFRNVYRLDGYLQSSKVAGGTYFSINNLDPHKDNWAKSSHRSTYLQAQIDCINYMINWVKKECLGTNSSIKGMFRCGTYGV